MRKIHTFSILVILLHLSISSMSQQTVNGTLIHDNVTRDYIIYVPASYSADKPVPLLLSFHGMTSNAKWMKTYTGFTQIADTAGFIVVFPQGLKDSSGNTFWHAWTLDSRQKPDDVGFTEALLNKIKSTYNIDSQRIYSTGHSNGGFMSHLLAIKTNHFAAIAANAGTISSNIYKQVSPLHPTAVLTIHGDMDNTVPYYGGGFNISVDETTDYWIGINNCNDTPIVTNLPDKDPNDNATVTHYVYSGGDNNTRVELLKVNNGGHSWPGSTVGMNICNDIHTASEIWRFLSQFSLSETTDNEVLKKKH